MKKIAFILLALTFCLNSFSQEDSIKSKNKLSFVDDTYGAQMQKKKTKKVDTPLPDYLFEKVPGGFVYCQLVGTANFTMTKVTVEIDFGQARKVFERNKRLLDENGKPIKFNSMVDAMNYMGSMGWEFVQAYVVTVNNSNVYHWLLKKKLKEETVKDE